jgi:hypothetical protein
LPVFTSSILLDTYPIGKSGRFFLSIIGDTDAGEIAICVFAFAFDWGLKDQEQRSKIYLAYLHCSPILYAGIGAVPTITEH